jgi:hypothetical protein
MKERPCDLCGEPIIEASWNRRGLPIYSPLEPAPSDTGHAVVEIRGDVISWTPLMRENERRAARDHGENLYVPHWGVCRGEKK